MRLLIFLLIASLPLFGFSILNIGTRGIQLDWLIIAMMALAFVARASSRKRMIIGVPGGVLLGLFGLHLALVLSSYNLLSASESSKFADFFTVWSQMVVGSVLFVILASYRTSAAGLAGMVKLYLVIAMLVAGVGLAQFVGNFFGVDLVPHLTNVGVLQPSSGYEELLGGFRRPTSIFAEPRQFGSFLVPAFFVVLQVRPAASRRLLGWKPLTSISIGLVLILGLVLSLSLSAYMSTVVTLGGLVILGRWHHTHSRWISLRFIRLIILAGFVVITLSVWGGIDLVGFVARRVLDTPGFDRIVSIITSGDPLEPSFGSASYFISLKSSLNVWAGSPLTGVGLNNIQYHTERWMISSLVPPFRILAETGTIGVVAFGLFLIAFFRMVGKSFRLTRSNEREREDSFARIALVIAVATLSSALLGSNFQYASTWFWFNLGFSAMIFMNLRRFGMAPRSGSGNLNRGISGIAA